MEVCTLDFLGSKRNRDTGSKISLALFFRWIDTISYRLKEGRVYAVTNTSTISFAFDRWILERVKRNKQIMLLIANVIAVNLEQNITLSEFDHCCH